MPSSWMSSSCVPRWTICVAALWVTDRFQGKTSTGGKITYKGAPPIVRSGAKFMGGDITRVE